MTQPDLDVSRETLSRLDHLVGLVRKWNPAINLVSKSTLPDIWVRHIQDSLQLANAVEDPGGHWADFGSGGGFPGLVVALAFDGGEERTDFSFVESDQRKATFLRQAASELGLAVTVHAARVEDVAPLSASTISARALAPLADLLEMAEGHLAPGGICMFPKGEQYEREIVAARRNWSFRSTKITSITNPRSVILRLEEIVRV